MRSQSSPAPDVFWPTLPVDGSFVCNVGANVILADMRIRFGLPAKPPEDEEIFGGFRVTVSKTADGYWLVFSDVTFVAGASSL